MHLTENRRNFFSDILKLLACVGTCIFLGVCTIIWLHTPPPKADQLRPLMNEIGGYKAKFGKYPTSCDQFASFAKLTNQFSIYFVYASYIPQRTILLEGRIDGWNIKDHDFTILLNPDGYKLFFPIAGTERDHPFNFDFAAWCYDSKKGHWQKGRIHDTSFGPYWKPGFIP